MGFLQSKAMSHLIVTVGQGAGIEEVVCVAVGGDRSGEQLVKELVVEEGRILHVAHVDGDEAPIERVAQLHVVGRQVVEGEGRRRPLARHIRVQRGLAPLEVGARRPRQEAEAVQVLAAQQDGQQLREHDVLVAGDHDAARLLKNTATGEFRVNSQSGDSANEIENIFSSICVCW